MAISWLSVSANSGSKLGHGGAGIIRAIWNERAAEERYLKPVVKIVPERMRHALRPASPNDKYTYKIYNPKNRKKFRE
jgi:hypothetical protein